MGFNFRNFRVSARLLLISAFDSVALAWEEDRTSVTWALASTMKYGGNKDAATAVGKAIGERAKAAGIEAVCFDRGPFKYHGRVAALADAAREAGLKF